MRNVPRMIGDSATAASVRTCGDPPLDHRAPGGGEPAPGDLRECRVTTRLGAPKTSLQRPSSARCAVWPMAAIASDHATTIAARNRWGTEPIRRRPRWEAAPRRTSSRTAKKRKPTCLLFRAEVFLQLGPDDVPGVAVEVEEERHAAREREHLPADPRGTRPVVIVHGVVRRPRVNGTRSARGRRTGFSRSGVGGARCPGPAGPGW